MRILTVRQPWAWAIIHGGKDIENRSRNLAGDYRGPVAIHAGLAKPEKDNQASRLHARLHGTGVDTELVFGAILGVVDLVEVHYSDTQAERWDAEAETPTTCSPWAMDGPIWHLELANPRALKEPIPYTGALGLRTLPETVTTQIMEGLTK